MASNGTLELLPGQSAPLATITSLDQGGVVVIAASLGLAFALVATLLRIYMQLAFRRKLANDDFAAVAALVLSVAQASAVFVAVAKGLGKTLSDVSSSDLIPQQEAIYTSDILYILIIWLTKCSVGLLFVRLSPDKYHNLMSYGILVASTLSMFISVMIVGLKCDLSHPWIFINAQCPNLFTRWQIVAAFDITTELALFATSIYLVMNLQLSIQKKSLVVSAFGLRLPIIAPTILRLLTIRTAIHSTDPTLKGSLVAVYTQIAIAYAIIAATTPCLRPFMSALNTNYGAPASTKSSPNTTNAYFMNSISKRSRKNNTQNSKKGKQTSELSTVPVTRWDRSEHHASVVQGDRHSMSSHDSKRMIISKNTEWTVDYERQPSTTSI